MCPAPRSALQHTVLHAAPRVPPGTSQSAPFSCLQVHGDSHITRSGIPSNGLQCPEGATPLPLPSRNGNCSHPCWFRSSSVGFCGRCWQHTAPIPQCSQLLSWVMTSCSKNLQLCSSAFPGIKDLCSQKAAILENSPLLTAHWIWRLSTPISSCLGRDITLCCPGQLAPGMAPSFVSLPSLPPFPACLYFLGSLSGITFQAVYLHLNPGLRVCLYSFIICVLVCAKLLWCV